MKNIPVLILCLALLFTAGCAKQAGSKHAGMRSGSKMKVRTTAYASCEGSPKNAIGTRLSNGSVKSAASDWSRFPLGTKFKILSTSEIFQIDDYGSALIGTNTIDLYKSCRSDMNRWGVKHVDIEILQWGDPKRSLEVLAPRKSGYVRSMVSNLRRGTQIAAVSTTPLR